MNKSLQRVKKTKLKCNKFNDYTLYQTDTWTMIESMSTRRSSVGVGVVGEQLYAVGGYDGSCRQCLNSYVYFDKFYFQND